MKQPEWLEDVALQQFFSATREAGGEARAVGGAVRDFLMGNEGADVDIASTLVPEKTMEIAASLGWKAVPTGIAHGTVTLVLPTRVVEVTTLRRDVTTDGRRATVAFTDDWREDAARRDFTINAIYMDATGMLHDFHEGTKDIVAHRVRFIGDATARIREDGLRILRFFRFLASHGKPPADAAALAACTAEREMIAQLSGERIANEMRKLLSVPNPAFALRLMTETGVAREVFGAEIQPQRMIRLHMIEAQVDHQASVWARIALLLGADQKTSQDVVTRWKISRHEAAQLELLTKLPAFKKDDPQHAHTRLLRLHGAPAYMDWLLLHAALQPGVDVVAYTSLAETFVAPVFPVAAADLIARGMEPGKALGEALALLEKRWEESDYTLTAETLLRDVTFVAGN